VQGIFPPLADGSDINAVERSQDHTIVATGDDFSKVKLFRYPNPIEKAPFKEYTGHSSHVTNVSFSRNQFGQKHLISTGGRDKAIFCWKYIKSGVAVQQDYQPPQK
jgi:WD40 repeat protein